MNWSPRWARPWYLRLRGKMRVSRTWHTELHGVRARCTHGVRNLRAIFAPASWKVATLSSSSEDSPAATTADPGRLSRWRLSSWRRCGRRPPGSSASEVRRAARAPAAAVARLVGYPRTARSGASCHAQHALADPMLAGRQHQTDRKNRTKESYLAATVAFIGSVLALSDHRQTQIWPDRPESSAEDPASERPSPLELGFGQTPDDGYGFGATLSIKFSYCNLRPGESQSGRALPSLESPDPGCP